VAVLVVDSALFFVREAVVGFGYGDEFVVGGIIVSEGLISCGMEYRTPEGRAGV
jgi:hypothetical protein